MAYQQLFSIHIGHRYFTSGMCENLRFLHTNETVRLMAQAGLISRETGSSIHIFLDTEHREALELCANDQAEPLELVFKARSMDPFFWNFTEVAGEEQDNKKVLFFSNHNMEANSDHSFSLHRGEFASKNDLVNMKSPELNTILAKEDALRPPLFVVKILVRPGDLPQDGQADIENRRRYVISFKPRSTYWKYIMQGDLVERNLMIADRSGTMEFTSLGSERLASSINAQIFRSGEPLALSQSPEQCFQLKENGASNPKVLIRRLPTASAKQVRLEKIDNRVCAVSEIYVA